MRDGASLPLSPASLPLSLASLPLSLSRRRGLLSLSLSRPPSLSLSSISHSLPPSLSPSLPSLSLSRPPSLSRLPLSPSSYLGDAEPAAGYLPTPEAAPQRCFVTGLENSSVLLESLDSAAASVVIEDEQMRRIEQMRKVFLSPALSLSRLPPSRALSCMRAYAHLTGRRRKISPPSLPRSFLSSLLASPRDRNCFRREKRREEESLPLSRSLSLSRLPPSRALSCMRAYARLTGRRRKISPPSLPRSLLSSLLASPRDGNCFRREKRREEEILPLSRSPSLSRLPPSRALSCMRAYARLTGRRRKISPPSLPRSSLSSRRKLLPS